MNRLHYLIDVLDTLRAAKIKVVADGKLIKVYGLMSSNELKECVEVYDKTSTHGQNCGDDTFRQLWQTRQKAVKDLAMRCKHRQIVAVLTEYDTESMGVSRAEMNWSEVLKEFAR